MMGRKLKKAPRFVSEKYRTMRIFKQVKREQLRLVMAAWSNYSVGCAWTPGYPNLVERIESDLIELRDLLSQKNWGR